MRELYALVFSVCVVLIGTEMIVRLFPEKSGSLIHALAVLILLVVLVNGILKLQSGTSLDFDLTETGEAESTITQSYAEKGTAILKERLSALFSLCLSSVAYTVSPIVRSVTVTCGSFSPVIAETICAICAESALV